MPRLFSALPRLRRAPALHALALAAACALPGAALAQDAALPALRLKSTPMLDERLPASGVALPTFVRGERITGGSNIPTVVEGDAELRKAGMVLRSARLQHDARHDIASTDSEVRLNHAGNRYRGSSARMQVDAHEAVVHDPSYQLLANGAHGTAQRLDMPGADHVTIWGATYTTCQCKDEGGKPDWILRSQKLELDHEEGVGRAKGAVLEFKGFPLLPLPGVSFPLSSARRSGLLAPTIGLDNKSGLSFLQPYYFNIAPNRDATLWPHLMLRRGLNLGGQFRYLERSYRGRISAHYMANDRLRAGRNRWGVFARHDATLHTGIGPVGAYLNLNRVSDDDHWRDFSTQGAGFDTTRLLANEGALTWSRGNLSVSALASKWQTLQSVGDAVIVPPYDRLPQLTARYARTNHGGFDYSAETGFTRFRGDHRYTHQPDADRTHAVVQVARPFERSWGFVTPMAQVHSTHYSFSGNGTTLKSQQRTVPTFSLDSGLIFERTTSFRGHTLLQTLEPRLKYVYSPYREQKDIPLYDTGAYDFNFATIWAENPYTGHDRIADNNLITAGVTSRFLDAASGAEKLRLAIAQRYRFTPQRLTNTDKGWSDMMLGAGLHWNPRWSFDATVQYNTHTRRSTRSTLLGRYTPGPYRTLSVAYRWQRRQYPLSSEYIDIAWQWPFGRSGELGHSASRGGGCGKGRWYSVGRLNYSRSDSHLIDGVLGVEYDAGCWTGRAVLENTNIGSASANKRFLFQLEFRGFGRVGNNPLAALRTHIPRYRPLGESVAPTPSRFHSYD